MPVQVVVVQGKKVLQGTLKTDPFGKVFFIFCVREEKRKSFLLFLCFLDKVLEILEKNKNFVNIVVESGKKWEGL